MSLPDIILDEGTLAKVGALTQLGEHDTLAAAGLGDGDGALLDYVEALPALALPENGLPRPEFHRLQRARYQLPVVLLRRRHTLTLTCWRSSPIGGHIARRPDDTCHSLVPSSTEAILAARGLAEAGQSTEGLAAGHCCRAQGQF